MRTLNRPTGGAAIGRLASRLTGRGTDGQALVEFALVLPVLVLVGLGTLQAAAIYQRAIALDAAAFLADRAAAVQGPRASAAAHEVVAAYGQDLAGTGHPPAAWIAKLKPTVSTDGTGTKVHLEDVDEAWARVLSNALAATGARPPKLVLTSDVALPQEFVADPTSGSSSAAHRPTSRIVDYQVQLAALDAVAKAPLIGQALQLDRLLAALPLPPGGSPIAGLDPVALHVGLDPTVQAYPPNRWKDEVGAERQGVHPSAHDYVSADNASIQPGPDQVQAGLEAGRSLAQALPVLIKAQPALALNPGLVVLAQLGTSGLAGTERAVDAGARAFFATP